MFAPFSNLLISWGISRDDKLWLWTKLLAIATLITSGVVDVGYWAGYVGLHPSVTTVHWVQVIAIVLLYLSGQYSTSSLPGKKG